MERINLKRLKEALNKLPDENLECFYLSHMMPCDPSEPRLGLVHTNIGSEMDDENRKMFKNEDFKVVKDFAKAVADDAKKVALCLIDEDLIEKYLEDV